MDLNEIFSSVLLNEELSQEDLDVLCFVNIFHSILILLYFYLNFIFKDDCELSTVLQNDSFSFVLPNDEVPLDDIQITELVIFNQIHIYT